MFAYPATHHFGRTYSSINPSAHPTTSRKNVNKENAGALPSKTPSRAGKMLVPSTSMRVGLGVKSTVKDGNVQQQSSRDGNGKGNDEGIEPKRLFTSHPGSSKTGLPPSKSLSQLPSINSYPSRTPATRPRQALNLRTPAPVAEPPTPLPSASRTRRRSRQSLTPLRQAPGPAEFKTPAPSGKWDEDISLGSIEVELAEVVEVDEGDADEEVEYMPPPAPEQPYEPPFERVDLAHAFSILSNVPPLWMPSVVADNKVPDFEPVEQPEERVRLCDDDMLEEPLFRDYHAVAEPSVPLPGPPTAKGKSGAPGKPPLAARPNTVRPGARPAGTVARPTAASLSRSTASTLSKATTAKPVPARPAATKSVLAQSTRPAPARVPLRPSGSLSVASRSATSSSRIIPRAAAAQPAPKTVIKIDVPDFELYDEPGAGDFELSLDLSFDSLNGDAEGNASDVHGEADARVNGDSA